MISGSDVEDPSVEIGVLVTSTEIDSVIGRTPSPLMVEFNLER